MKKWFWLLFLFLFILGCNITPESEQTIQEQITPEQTITEQESVQACNDLEGDDKIACELAEDKPNLQQCLANNVTSYKFFCIALISKDPEICSYIKSSSKEAWCKAYVTKDASLCDSIQDEAERDECYIDIGINFKDKNICDKISDEKSKTSCIAATADNAELCLEGAEKYKVNCIVNIIESTGNTELCNSLSDEKKEECFEQAK